ncbi:hypothetical protein [Nonomuraea zeae]|uniref:hypothetical protein n=1 Tax=Nonomuraea zeae TaxID=1642303 RepID=UPI0019824528|nr:hypothetical protein [Nonomuraea zeae]
MDGPSLATRQRSLGDPATEFPLFPPLTRGCPKTSTDEIAYPLEVGYDYARVDPALFDQEPGTDIARWSPLLPPLEAPTLGEGGFKDLGVGAGSYPVLDHPALGDLMA